MGRATSAIAVIIVILLGITGVYYLVNDTNYLGQIFTTGQYTIPSTVNTSFSRNFSFSSSSPLNESFSFFITPPQNGSFQRTNVTISHSSTVRESVVNNHDRTYLKFDIFQGNSYIDIHYNITSKGESWQNLYNLSGNVSAIPSYLKDQYDHPEFFNSSNRTYEVINPLFFENLTINLTSNQSSVAGKLRAIYNYIVQNYRYDISYNIGNIPLTAQQVYNNKIGDCEELSYLFESMSRSIGIPSWTQYGLLLQDINGQYSLAEHAWVQAYIPLSNNTGTYVNVDMTVEVGGQDLGRGFMVKFPNSIVEWTDNGNTTDMVSYHTELVFPSTGLNITLGPEVDTFHSFKQSGQIVLTIDKNIFIIRVSNAVERIW